MLKNTKVKVQNVKKPLDKMYLGFIDTLYGQMVLGSYSEDGVLYIALLNFTEGRSMADIATDIRKRWPGTECIENDQVTQSTFLKYFVKKDSKLVYIVLNGTEFQIDVWLALLKIPYGEERTYGEVAAMIKRPEAVRAVATAVGKNNIAIFVPCHRVKAKHNDKQKYRWGRELKIKIMGDERDINK